jgi:SAM-dependent methyltransferase
MIRTALLKLAIALLGFAGLLAAAAAQSPSTHQHSFSGAEQWAHVFDDPKRDAWQKPHEVIQALALGPDAVVADIGSGTGYFAVRFANMVPRGRVYGVDVEPDMVRYLAERAKRERSSRVEPRSRVQRASWTRGGLPPGCAPIFEPAGASPMCELFAMSNRVPADVRFALEESPRHGGLAEDKIIAAGEGRIVAGTGRTEGVAT